MHFANKAISTVAIATLLGVGALAATAGTASARVVCNAQGDCWHTDQKAKYPRDLKVTIHPDDWYFHQDWANDKAHQFRDYHAGHGYYRGGIWITL
jgi:hypothetical protein